MFSKIVGPGLILWLCAFGLTANAQAQEPIPPEKRALIQELLSVTNAQINYEAMIDQMLRLQEEEMTRHIEKVVEEQKGPSPQEREKLRKDMLEKSLRFSRRFRELLPQRIDMKHEVEAVTFPIYSKYFTEQDLRDMISFYKSPAGRKSMEVMPRILADAVQMFQTSLTPKVEALVKEIMDEEKDEEKANRDPVVTPK